MSIESWMVNVGIALAGIIGTYAVLRNRVERLEKDMAKHVEDASLDKSESDRKLSAQFKRLDSCTERVVVLEQSTATHLDMNKVEEKFVSKQELNLHLRNIELVAQNTNQKVEKMEGKLDELIEALSTCSSVQRRTK